MTILSDMTILSVALPKYMKVYDSMYSSRDATQSPIFCLDRFFTQHLRLMRLSIIQHIFDILLAFIWSLLLFCFILLLYCIGVYIYPSEIPIHCWSSGFAMSSGTLLRWLKLCSIYLWLVCMLRYLVLPCKISFFLTIFY